MVKTVDKEMTDKAVDVMAQYAAGLAKIDVADIYGMTFEQIHQAVAAAEAAHLKG